MTYQRGVRMDELTVWQVDQAGHPTVYFADEEQARRYANEQFDFNTDGIPFRTKVVFRNKSEIIEALNRGSHG